MTFELLVDFHEIQQRGNPDTIIFNPITWTILKWEFQTSDVAANVHKSALDYQGLSSLTIVEAHRNSLL
jgi:hypothetical protein